MDSVSARPAVAAPPPPTPQEAQGGTAKTELLPAKTVSRSEAGQRAGTSGGDDGQARLAGSRTANANSSLSLDAETQTVILKKTDSDTGEVLAQYPNDAQLGLRTYARELTGPEPAYEAVA
ncbi:MAG: hypothetical protein AAF141_12205 [Pseudomonadota bacterium]